MLECPLCILTKKTKWYYENEQIVVCDYLTCNKPMIVLREHTIKVTPKTIYYITETAEQLFGTNIKLRTQQRAILDHLHWHVLIEPT